MESTYSIESVVRDSIKNNGASEDLLSKTTVRHIMTRDYPFTLQMRADTQQPAYLDSVMVICQFRFGVLMTVTQHIRTGNTGLIEISDLKFSSTQFHSISSKTMLKHIGYSIADVLLRVTKGEKW